MIVRFISRLSLTHFQSSVNITCHISVRFWLRLSGEPTKRKWKQVKATLRQRYVKPVDIVLNEILGCLFVCWLPWPYRENVFLVPHNSVFFILNRKRNRKFSCVARWPYLWEMERGLSFLISSPYPNSLDPIRTIRFFSESLCLSI